MTKEEAIKQAWGDDRFSVLSPEISENGWLDEDYLLNKHEFNLSDCDTENGAYLGLDDLTTYYRPKSLKGIETNNGWIKIESEEDLPERDKLCVWISKDKGMIRSEFERTGETDNYIANDFSHWRYKIIEPDPIY